MKKTFSLLVLLALFCACAGLHAQTTNAPTTNIVVTVLTPAAAPTVHSIKVPAGAGPALRASLLPQIDPQYASVTGKSATSISLHKNPDGSWSGTVIFQ